MADRATRVQSGQSVSPYNTTTPAQSTIKSSSNNHYCSSTSRTITPSQRVISGILPKRQPQEDQKTCYINAEGHLQCHQDPQNIITAPHSMGFPGQRNTPFTTNLAQSRSAVYRTFLSSIPTHLIGLNLSRENMTLKLIQQCHQYNTQGGRYQLKARQPWKRPLTTW